MLQINATTQDACSEYTLDDEIGHLPENLVNIMADGEELVWIKHKFSIALEREGEPTIRIYSIPMIHTADRMYWKGDIAKTILINLW